MGLSICRVLFYLTDEDNMLTLRNMSTPNARGLFTEGKKKNKKKVIDESKM